MIHSRVKTRPAALFLAGAAGLLAVGGAAPAMAQEAPDAAARDFGARSSVLDISLSPSGTKIAYIAPGPEHSEVINVIDPSPAIAQATAQADFPLVTPIGLSDAWRPTSARWEPSPESGTDPVLHIGYVTPTDQYGQVSLSRSATERYLGEQTSGGRPIDTREVAGAVWQRWEADDRRSLVLIEDGVTTIVSGTGEWSEIEGLAATLQPVP